MTTFFRTLWRKLRGLLPGTRTISQDAYVKASEADVAAMFAVKAKLGHEFFKPDASLRHRIERANTLSSRESCIARRCGWI